PPPPPSAPLEAVVVVAIAFGWFIMASLEAVAQGFPGTGSFSDEQLLNILLMELLFGGIALAFLRHRGHALQALLPTPTLTGCLVGAALCGASVLAWQVLAQAVPASQLQAQPIAEIARNARPSLAMAIALSVVNGLYEETFLLGYLVRSFASAGASLALGLSLLVRVLYHLYQGPLGAVSVLMFGLILSVYYWHSRRLWPAVFAHTLADALALA
ncbi:MAG TPA: CPBP family intramembrane glutamic endopeptidase, partial [Burkholderiaceae bacterium]|nr:CPBP family intramembrane glutamic endopeptidase [Burkholderiaceae bacterium]